MSPRPVQTSAIDHEARRKVDDHIDDCTKFRREINGHLVTIFNRLGEGERQMAENGAAARKAVDGIDELKTLVKAEKDDRAAAERKALEDKHAAELAAREERDKAARERMKLWIRILTAAVLVLAAAAGYLIDREFRDLDRVKAQVSAEAAEAGQ